MTYKNKRHYRVAQKDRELEENAMCLNQDCLNSITIMGIVIYATSVMISMFLGYLIGKHE